MKRPKVSRAGTPWQRSSKSGLTGADVGQGDEEPGNEGKFI